MAIEFRACCCLKPRTGAIVAGTIDLLIGLATAIGIVLYQLGHFETMESSHHGGTPADTVTDEPAGNPQAQVQPSDTNSTSSVDSMDATADAHRWNAVTCLYAFTAFCAALHGILLLIAAGKKQSFFNGAALVENVVMILGCVGGTVALFILGYHWIDLTLMPFFIAIQIYFLWVAHDYQKYFSYSQPINVKARA